MTMLPPATATDYLAALFKAVPPGRLWRRGALGLGLLLEGMSAELARAHLIAVQAWTELFPGTADDMLGEWESILGLPNPCAPAPSSLEDRQAAAAARFAEGGSHEPGYYRRVAAELGVTIEIDDRLRTPFRADISKAGDVLWDEYQVFVWQVSGPAATDADVQDRLECIFDRIKPGHTEIIWSWTL